ncbi:MAG: S-methyl-5'-thioadenosine phosphorylase [Myxococcales bacterium]|nr:S-methyl-5'-thioadenosine phosphorylase [Myxococcales bacterium]
MSEPGTPPVVGIIGGSGLYAIEGLTDVETVTVETPYGAPSDALVLGTLEGIRCAFLPRHGRGHRFTPSEVNYRANLWALKSLGVRHIISVSAVGSLEEAVEPGHLVCVDQFIDRTRQRPNTFFGEGCVGHVQFGDPVEEGLRQELMAAARAVSGTTVHDGGAYVCIEGPTFSTRAESQMFRAWGARVVGMTNLPEARLAREAEMAYATLALSTDYDCWHAGHDEVSVESVLAVIQANVAAAKRVIRETCRRLAALGDVTWPAHAALGGGTAIMTRTDLIPTEARRRLQPIVGKYLWPEEQH